MNNDVYILDDRAILYINGSDAKDFLQNLISNDINKVTDNSSCFASLFTPQGKFLYEFMVVKHKSGYFIDCEKSQSEEIFKQLNLYKIRSKVEIEDLSSNYVVGVINFENFKIIQKDLGKQEATLEFRESPIFVDPRDSDLGARIISPLEKLYLTIKKLNLKIVSHRTYVEKAFLKGIPVEGLSNLQNQLFGLELNFEKLNAIDFKKGCYVGQENTARMKIKNKIRRQLMPIKTEGKVKIGDEIKYNEITIGKILINEPFPFALVKLYDPEFSTFKNEKLNINNNSVKIIT